jgi:peroxiredoxin
LTQLRQDYTRFTERGAEVISVGTEQAEDFRSFWEKNNLPFVGISDPDQIVLKLYGQEVSMLKLGRMPALFVIDKKGVIRFAHYAQSMSDIPSSDRVLEILDQSPASD